jgi:hypothetical protein
MTVIAGINQIIHTNRIDEHIISNHDKQIIFIPNLLYQQLKQEQIAYSVVGGFTFAFRFAFTFRLVLRFVLAPALPSVMSSI